MVLDSKSKVLLLISNEILVDDGLFVFLETLDFNIKTMLIKPENVRIFIDKSSEKVISQYQANGQRKEFKRSRGIIDIIKVLKLHEEIDTKSFRDFAPFIALKKEYKEFSLHFITNQSNRAQTLNLLNEDKSIIIEKFEEDYEMTQWKFDEPTVVLEKQKTKFEDAFFIKDINKYIAPTDTLDRDYVYTEKFGYLKLDKNNTMFGGEGKIYRTYDNMLVKIYAEDQRRYETIKKIQHMINLDLRNKYIVWPKDIVYNNNEFVGYVMEEVFNAKGLDMYRIYSFLNMQYSERFEICLELLYLAKYLHEKNILIGDLKFDNILYTDDTKELYIIDSASFQIEDYSCGVYNADYTHENLKGDNLKGRNLREVLRTLEEEYFPINKILFEILVGKGPYYDFVNGEVGSEVDRVFHWPLEDLKQVTSQKDPLFYWVNADERLRYAFHDYFVKDIITEVDQWISLLEDILNKGGRK